MLNFKKMLMSNLVIDIEIQNLFYLDIPSSVPAVWFSRFIIVQILELIATPYYTTEMLQKGSKKCGEFEHLWPSEKYLDLTFE